MGAPVQTRTPLSGVPWGQQASTAGKASEGEEGGSVEVLRRILSQKGLFQTSGFFPSKCWNVSSRRNSSHRNFSSFQIGHLEGEPSRRGAFPVSFVHFIAD